MLLQMRNFTRSWVSYLLLFLLSLLFVVFLGNGQSMLDLFQQSASTEIASGRGVSIDARDLQREFDQSLRAIRLRNPNVDRDAAIKGGLPQQVLEQMVSRTAIISYLDEVGATIGEADLDRTISQRPEAQNPVSGTYDPDALTRNLAEFGQTYAQYRRQVRGEINANMFIRSTVQGARPPSSFGALQVAYDGETRVASVAEAPLSAIVAVPAPTEEQLSQFWRESQEMLRVPEFRALSLVFARPEDFAASVTLSDERLNAEVETRRAEAAQPEKRTYSRVSAPSEALARQAAERLAHGEGASAIAAALGNGATGARSENQSRAGIPDTPVAEAVFAARAGAAPSVVQGRLNWAAVRVESITPAIEPNLEALRLEARARLGEGEARQLIGTAITAYEDARDGGASVAEAARQSGLTVVSIPPVNARGLGQDGRPVAAMVERRAELATAFELTDGDASDFQRDDDVVVSVDRIIPSFVRALDDARIDLTRNWTARERSRLMRELGERIKADISGGQNLAAVARTRGLRMMRTSQSYNRTAAAQALSQSLAGQIFAASDHGVALEIADDGHAMRVGVVESIQRVDPAAHPQELEAARAAQLRSLESSLGEAVESEIVARANVRRRQDRIDALFPDPDAREQEEQ
ncbi:MAG: SurA N-terminal domain-containing protein [Terricaulis sp.]